MTKKKKIVIFTGSTLLLGIGGFVAYKMFKKKGANGEARVTNGEGTYSDSLFSGEQEPLSDIKEFAEKGITKRLEEQLSPAAADFARLRDSALADAQKFATSPEYSHWSPQYVEAIVQQKQDSANAWTNTIEITANSAAKHAAFENDMQGKSMEYISCHNYRILGGSPPETVELSTGTFQCSQVKS